MKTIVLYRPVGPKELDLIKQLDYKAFPPRLLEQPFFYPVLNIEYAKQITEWNKKEFGAGYITKFLVKKKFLDSYSIKIAGSGIHQEYWIPSSELEILNANIVGNIEVLE